MEVMITVILFNTLCQNCLNPHLYCFIHISPQTFGIIFTMAMGSLLQEVSVKVANLFLCGSLLIGSVLTGKDPLFS